MQSISFGRVSLLLAIATIGACIFLSIQFLVDPLSLPWMSLEDPVIIPIEQLIPPQTLGQIKLELSDSQLLLGDKLIPSSSGYEIYPILDLDSKSIRQIRIYQSLTDGFWQDQEKRKLRLINQTEVKELEEAFIKAPTQRYLLQPKELNPKNTLPLTELKLIYGDPPSQGTWFTTVGRVDGIVYGQVFSYLPSQKLLNLSLEWTNPNGKLPEWQRFPTVKNSEPDLVIDQTQDFDPMFLVFRLETAPNSEEPLQFRYLNLHESPAMPKVYNQALVLASGGLWSPALAKLESLRSDLQAKDRPWDSEIQEQFDLISFHAQITSEGARKITSDYGINSLMLGMDGLWGEALKNLQGSEFGAKIVFEMLETSSQHLWMRVNTALEVEPSPDVLIWGSVIVLQRQDLPSAEKWLRSHWKFPKQNISEAISLLQKLDLSPLGIEPEQFVGSIRLVGNSLEDKWQIPPPAIIVGQTWYEVDIDVIRDQDIWRDTPFPKLDLRSRLIIWKALGLEANNILTVTIPNTDGETASLIAQSIWVGNGQIKLLAMGSEELGTRLGSATALVKGGGLFIEPVGDFTSMGSLDQDVFERIATEIYGELQAFGRVSVGEDEFKEKLSRWSMEQVNLQGKESQDLVLKIDRDKIDLGDRSYPMVMVFSKTGDLLFGDMSSGATKLWVALLPSEAPQKILVKTNGYYQSLSFVP